MPNMVNKSMLGIDWGAQVDKTNDPYNLNNAGQYGLKKFDQKGTEDKINSMAQRQIQNDTGRTFRQGIANGDGNAEQSAYNATQSARDSRDASIVGLDKYANEDQYRQMNALLGIEGSKQSRENLDFQKQQYEEQKPGFWDDILGIAGVASDAIPFFPDGGVVDSDKVIQNGGNLNSGMQNAQPNQIHDKPVMIQANEGERIMSPEANSMFGKELMNMENQAQQGKQGGQQSFMQGDGLAGAHGYASGQGSQQAQGAGQGLDLQGIAKRLLGHLQTFAQGGTVQGQQQMGSMTGKDYSEGAYNAYKQDKALFDEYATMPQLRKSNLDDATLLKYQTAINNLKVNPFNENTPEAMQYKQQYEGKMQQNAPNMTANPNVAQGQQGLDTQTDFSHAQQAQPNGEQILNDMFKPKPTP